MNYEKYLKYYKKNKLIGGEPINDVKILNNDFKSVDTIYMNEYDKYGYLVFDSF
jgi:hypothetical protein